MIPIGKIGYIIKATYGVKTGWYVLVEIDPLRDIDAYYVYICKTRHFKDHKLFEEGYDYWFPCKEHVEELFQDWIVQWDEEKTK